MTDSTPAIFTAWTDYPASMARPFLDSASKYAPGARQVVFCGRVADTDIGELEDLGVDVVQVDDDYPPPGPRPAITALGRIKTTRGLRKYFPRAVRIFARATGAVPGTPKCRSIEFRFYGIQSLRYRHYLAYLETHPEVSQVIISDLRDVVFQADPFQTPIEGLELYLEEPHVRTTVDDFNRWWLNDLYGARGLEVIGDEVISCSGVTAGSRDAMLLYLRTMASELDRHWPPLGPHDQAAHNWLLRTGQIDDNHVIVNGQGRVITAGEMHGPWTFDGEGRLTVQGGATPAVVHQYDRHQELVKHFL